jgi:hypothetical protein
MMISHDMILETMGRSVRLLLRVQLIIQIINVNIFYLLIKVMLHIANDV